MVALILRFASLALLGAWLVLFDRRQPLWVIGLTPALVTLFVVAIAVISEPRMWLRRVELSLVALAYVAWMLHEDRWHTEPSWLRDALFTMAEAAVIAPFLESRLWRWSLIPGLLLVLWLLYHLFPTYGGSLRRDAWLLQALILLIVNAARRAMREDDEQYRRHRNDS